MSFPTYKGAESDSRCCMSFLIPIAFLILKNHVTGISSTQEKSSGPKWWWAMDRCRSTRARKHPCVLGAGLLRKSDPGSKRFVWKLQDEEGDGGWWKEDRGSLSRSCSPLDKDKRVLTSTLRLRRSTEK